MATFQRKSGVTGEVILKVEGSRYVVNNERPQVSTTNTAAIRALQAHPQLDEIGGPTVLPDFYQQVVKEYDSGSDDIVELDNGEEGIVLPDSVGGGSSSPGAKNARDVHWNPPNTLYNLPMGRFGAISSQSVLASGRLTLVGGLVVPEDTTVTHVLFAAATNFTGMSNLWFCLVSKDRATIYAKTVDDGATGWVGSGATQVKSLALSSPWTPSSDTPVYCGIVAVGTVGNLLAASSVQSLTVTTAPYLSGGYDTGLTNPASLSAVSVTTPAANSFVPLCGIVHS